MKINFDNVTHSSKYSKQGENPIRNQSLTLLRFKCEAPGLLWKLFDPCTHDDTFISASITYHMSNMMRVTLERICSQFSV